MSSVEISLKKLSQNTTLFVILLLQMMPNNMDLGIVSK